MDTLVICPKCNGTGRIEPDESGYDGCDLCNYGEGPTGFVPDYSEQTIAVQKIAEALRSAKPHAPFGPCADHARAQIIGWRYAVVRVADVLQKELPGFDCARFYKDCNAV